MITECSNCSGEAAELCERAYKVSAQKVAGLAEDLVISSTNPESALRIITNTREHELSALSHMSRTVLPSCNLSPEQIELRLDEAIVEAGNTLSSS